jgi:aspartate kinase
MAPDSDQPEAATPVVMKFGGSSVADLDRLRRVAGFVVERARAQPVVVVVSAMGKTTDGLVGQARTLCDAPSQREMDMLLTTGERISMALLSLAIHGLGREAVSLTGSQCGIITDHQHGRARIMEVRPFRILDELAAGHVVIVGGFQGVSYKREVTTLGRGGSDTTAVALAAALSADCEIYSDVDGVYSADPRVVEEAARIDALSYAEMRALSRAGAKVLHARAVEMAEERGIAIYARATPSDANPAKGQTIIRRNPPTVSGVRAVTSDPGVVDLWIARGDAPEANAWVSPISDQLGSHGLRYLAIDEHGARGVLSTTARDDADAVLGQIETFVREHFGGRARVDARRGHALVSCIGSGLEDRGAVLERALELLAEIGVAPTWVRTDANTLAFLVEADQADPATRALHEGLVTGATRERPR